jgi:hypothetical protein
MTHSSLRIGIPQTPITLNMESPGAVSTYYVMQLRNSRMFGMYDNRYVAVSTTPE